MAQRRNSNRSNSRSNSSDDSLMSNWGSTARDNPITTAAAAAGAVAAGVFLWSKRNEISEQISRLSDQITDWAEDMRSNMGSSSSEGELALTGGPNESSAIESSRATAKRNTGRTNGSASRSSSSTSGTQSNQTTGGRSQGANQTF